MNIEIKSKDSPKESKEKEAVPVQTLSVPYIELAEVKAERDRMIDYSKAIDEAIIRLEEKIAELRQDKIAAKQTIDSLNRLIKKTRV